MDTLPIPSGNNIYSYEKEIWNLHFRNQSKLYKNKNHKSNEFNIYRLPILNYVNFAEDIKRNFLEEIIIPKPSLSGRPIFALEPHPDDLILSLGGTILSWRRPVHVITFFNRSRNLHPRIRTITELSNESITSLRHQENRSALSSLGATQTELDLWEAKWPLSSPDYTRIPCLIEKVKYIYRQYEDSEIIAPFAISHHPDHLMVRHVAEALGCVVFWEDVDFYVNYARSVEDVEYARLIWKSPSKIDYIDIDQYVMSKFALLTLYQSQYFFPEAVVGPLRFNWSVAQKAQRKEKLPNSVRYAERVFKYI